MFSTISDLVLFIALSHECSFSKRVHLISLVTLRANLQTIHLCLKQVFIIEQHYTKIKSTLGLVCLTTGNRFMMSSSVNVGYFLLSKSYSRSKICTPVNEK